MGDLNLNLDSTSKIILNYQSCSRNGLYIVHLNLGKDDMSLLKDKLSKSEFDMMSEIMASHDVGSSMLVMVGLRAICESLINKICRENKIPLNLTRSDGAIEEKGLTKKFNESKKFIKKYEYRNLVYNIITIANRSVHELATMVMRDGTEKYITDLINMLREENIFNNLNKKNEPTTTTSSN